MKHDSKDYFLAIAIGLALAILLVLELSK